MLFDPEAVIYVDGASRGNPGPAAYGFAVYDSKGTLIHQEGKPIGKATNNIAEYTALLKALQFAVRKGIPTIEIRSDSQLLVRQMKGEYKVKSENIIQFHLECKNLAKQFQWIDLQHIPREKNRVADRLANQALDHEKKIKTSQRGA